MSDYFKSTGYTSTKKFKVRFEVEVEVEVGNDEWKDAIGNYENEIDFLIDMAKVELEDCDSVNYLGIEQVGEKKALSQKPALPDFTNPVIAIRARAIDKTLLTRYRKKKEK